MMETVERDWFAEPRQGKVRRIVALFNRHPEFGDSLFGGTRESAQRLSTLDTGPENPRAARIREPAEALDRDIDRACDGHRRQRALHFFQARFRPLSDELGGDVQAVDRTPDGLRGRPQAA